MVDEPKLPKRPPRNVDTSKWCEYRRTVGHDTDDCYTLKREMDKLIKVGHLRRYVQKNDRQQDSEKEQKKETLATKKRGAEGTFSQELGPPAGTINTIAAGFAGVATRMRRKRGMCEQ